MKKKQRCLLKRFAALVAALMLCASLCVPCFASNNASTKKWVVKSEAMMTNEKGTVSRYLQLTPYVGGEIYAATFTSYAGGVNLGIVTEPSSISNSYWITPVNYPDWWRAAIPLGAQSYIAIDNLRIQHCLRNNEPYTPNGVNFFFYKKSDMFDYSLNSRGYFDDQSVDFSITGSLHSFPVFGSSYGASSPSSPSDISGSYAGDHFVPLGSSTYTTSLSDSQQVVPSFGYWHSSGSPEAIGFWRIPALKNLSSDDLVIGVLPYYLNQTSQLSYVYSLTCSAEISFFVDANKLPSGLKVGDEFPANDDAFESLREGLLEQFPEASKNIENGKSTIQGWNDTETVDSDVASTSISALNALFQNLGGFLFIVSLMVFGAVVLRMLIRKAVDG